MKQMLELSITEIELSSSVFSFLKKVVWVRRSMGA